MCVCRGGGQRAGPAGLRLVKAPLMKGRAQGVVLSWKNRPGRHWVTEGGVVRMGGWGGGEEGVW